MSAKQVREQLALAADNARIKKLVTLWGLLGAAGGVQIHRGKRGASSAWSACASSPRDGMCRH